MKCQEASREFFVMSSGFLGVCVCKVFGQTENDIIFSIFTMCMAFKSFRDAFFSLLFFFLDAPSDKWFLLVTAYPFKCLAAEIYQFLLNCGSFCI